MIFRNPQYRKTTLHMFAVVLLSLLAFVQPTVNAQTSIVTGKVTSVKGRAEISGNGRSKALAIVPGMNIEPGDLIETRGGAKVVIDLSDGSQAIVQSKARVLVNNYHTAHSPREFVQITVGRAVFKIRKIGGKPNPYRVTTPTASIAVRGTRFSVKVQKGGKTRVAVYEGLVAVDNTLDKEPEELVEPGEAVVVQKDEGVEFVPETEEEKKEAQCPDCKEEPPDENQTDKPEGGDRNASKEPLPTPTPAGVSDKSNDTTKPEPTPKVEPAESPTPLPEATPIPSPPEPSSTPVEPAKPESTPTPPVEAPPKPEPPVERAPSPRPEPTPTPEPPSEPPQPEPPVEPAPPPPPEPTPTPEPPPKSAPAASPQLEPPVLPDPPPSPPWNPEPSEEPPSDPAYFNRRDLVTKASLVSNRTRRRGW